MFVTFARLNRWTDFDCLHLEENNNRLNFILDKFIIPRGRDQLKITRAEYLINCSQLKTGVLWYNTISTQCSCSRLADTSFNNCSTKASHWHCLRLILPQTKLIRRRRRNQKLWNDCLPTRNSVASFEMRLNHDALVHRFVSQSQPFRHTYLRIWYLTGIEIKLQVIDL